MENIIEVRDLSKSYKEFSLKEVSFNVRRGYITGMIGPNGAGKTTIINLIMNLINRDSGTIKIFGEDNRENEVEIKQRIGFVYDTPYFYEDIKLKTISSVIAPFYRKWNEDKYRSLIKEFQLPLDKKFKDLSRGMKSKFALAIALSHEAELIIMDEPTSGLDPVFRRELLDILSDIIQDENKAVLFSTHITSDLERTADYITFINDGKLIFSSEKDEVINNWGIIKGSDDILKNEYGKLIKGYRKTDYGVEALTDKMDKAKESFDASVVIETAALEDIMYFMKKGARNAGTD